MTSASYPGCHSFVNLRNGLTHYTISQPDYATENTVVLIHGATVPMWEFDLLLPSLTAGGLICIQYDLFGHGFSDRPEQAYSIELFTDQLADLLHALQVQTPVSIVGHSLGAAIAAAYTCKYPDQVSKLILCAPLVNFESNQRLLRLLKPVCVGELLTHGLVIPMLVRRRTKRYRTLGHGRFPQMFKDQLLKPGFGRALLSLIRSGTLGDQLAIYESDQLRRKPLMLARGVEDDIITHNQFQQILSALPHASVCEPDSAGHAFLLTHPQLVADTFRRFLV